MSEDRSPPNDFSFPTDAELSNERGHPAGRTEAASDRHACAPRVFGDRLVLANGKTVLPHHLAELRASGLSEETIRGAGIHSETNYDEIASLLEWKPPKKMAPVLVFPVLRADGTPTGYAYVKPDHPRKVADKVVKYEAPRGRPARVYVPPKTHSALEDVTTELLITEGQKKALCADQHGFRCLGLAGVWNWKDSQSEVLSNGLVMIRWDGRPVIVVFDSDAACKPRVREAEMRLAAALVAQGARVKIARLPPGPPDADGKPTKVGLDDFLVAHGPGALRKLLSEAEEPEPLDPIAMKAPATQLDPSSEAKRFLLATAHDEHPCLLFWRGEFWKWKHGRYIAIPMEEVFAKLVSFLDRSYHSLGKSAVANVLVHLKSQSILSSQVEPPRWLGRPAKDAPPAEEVLVAKNGLLDLRSTADGRELLHPPTPQFFSTTALDYPFEATAQLPACWMSFLGDLWWNDQQSIDTLQEWFGLSLVADTSYQKILGLFGPPRCGKGTICRVLRGLIGRENVAGPTLSSLTTNFGLASLLGRSLAIISDVRLGRQADQAVILERLLSISGEDALTIDRKYLEPITCKLPSRLIMVSNELPALSDPSGAFAARMLVLRFTRSFAGKEDSQLTAKLLKELSGILLWALVGLRRLRDRGHFQQPESGARLLRDLEDFNSPIGRFVRELCVVGPHHFVPVGVVFAAWSRWCAELGLVPGNVQSFCRGLHAVVPGLGIVRSRVGEERQRVYGGIGLAPRACAVRDGPRT
jgi:putative DNA primase/helicase